MELKDFISFRKKIKDVEITSYGFTCIFIVQTLEDKLLIGEFEGLEIREAFYVDTKNTVDLKILKLGVEIFFRVDLSKFSNYYETFSDFLIDNKFRLRTDEFYIFDLDYFHNYSEEDDKITSFLKLQNVICFLKELSAHNNEFNGDLELFFHKPNNFCSIIVSYNSSDLQYLQINSLISELESHVFEKSDQEARRKLFTNEMINLLSIEGVTFTNLLKNWDVICNSYRNSFEIYLSEFSFDKIKTSSQEYFHELTDRIYSTINKFSTYILAIPVAYLLILRFFDFNGNSLVKDSFLVIIGLLYFVIIWFVLLDNLSNAFKAIEIDILNFLNRIKNEQYLKDIAKNLETQKDEIIPSQKRKILLVRIVSLIILVMTIGAYLFIYFWDCLNEFTSLIMSLGCVPLKPNPFFIKD